MSQEPLLKFDELVNPIPGDSEAGEPVPYELRQQLEEDRREEDPDAYAPGDPMRPEQPKRADWSGIIRNAQEILQRTSKDLLVAARLTEALTKRHGFAGVRDGLHLLGRLVNECWDRLNPMIEDGDVSSREPPFHWLDQSDRGARFPTTIRQLTLLQGSDGPLNYFDWKAYQDGKSKIPKEDFDKAIHQTPVQLCVANVELLDQCAQEWMTLVKALNEKMGSSAPGLTSVRDALENCRGVAKMLLQSKGGAPVEEAAPAADGQAVADGAPAAGGGAARPPASRAEAYRQLAQAATTLQVLEPHSPIPYLVQKAVELGSLPFPELMRRLIRDANVLTELNRELGIKGEEAPPSE